MRREKETPNMTIKELMAKVAKGETLTDEDKDFAGKYDPQKDIDAAAGAARKKAEQERDGFKAKVDELTAQLAEAQKSGTSADETIKKLQKDVAALMKTNKENEERLAAQVRAESIRKAASEAKVVCAKGISQSLFDKALAAAFDGVDMANADVVKATLDKFKGDNPAMIGVDGVGGVGTQGKPGGTGLPAVNPFSKKTFNLTEGLKLMQSNPEAAKQMQEAAKAEG